MNAIDQSSNITIQLQKCWQVYRKIPMISSGLIFAQKAILVS